MSSVDLTLFLANLPSDPGVYRMLNAEGVVLYVGKAANLRKRVNSYFTKQNNTLKTQSLVKQIQHIEISVTRTETEALLLESSFIKSLRPKYNVLMRDDKSYPYLYINTDHAYPRIEMIRRKKKPKTGLCFGPYPSAFAVRETLNTIQKLFKIRNCRDNYFSARSRPCLQYQIKRCTAPCIPYISAENYQQALDDAIRFLQGKCDVILQALAQKMEEAVKRLEYEEAALYRDQIKRLRLIQEQQIINRQAGDADVIAFDVRAGFACIECVSIREGQVMGCQHFFPTVPSLWLTPSHENDHEELCQQVLEAFVGFYYVDMPSRIPAQLILDEAISNAEPIEDLLSNLRQKKCKLLTKPRGEKAKWVDFARNNLRMAISEYMAAASTLSKRFHALAELLLTEEPIARMECFDISHHQGDATVASCVVFDKDGPRKKDYRRFNIEGITPGDDYAAMEQVLLRRFKRLVASQSLPDVLIIDGGKGQVNKALLVLATLNIKTVMVIGIAKGPERKPGWESLFLVMQEKEISLPGDSPALHLLQHIRDEAHRFAITSHRKKRQKHQFDSSLETIEGVGPKRRRALLQRFGGMRELAKAPLDEIAKVQGINAQLAERIFQHFRENGF